MEELLTYQSVEISFGESVVVQDIDLSLHPGEILGIVGESRYLVSWEKHS